MTFERLRAADWVAFLAALALLLVAAMDWYSTPTGEEARRIERLAEPSGAAAGEVEREVREDARLAAEREEDNAWQAAGVIDRVILVALLGAIALAVAAAFLRAAGRRFEPPWTPSALAATAAAVCAALVAYRIVQEPGLDVGTTVQLGAPLAALLLAVIAFASLRALRAEEQGRPFRQPRSERRTRDAAAEGGG